MKLNVKNRLLIMNVLCPKEADILTQMIVKSICEKTKLSDKEIAEVSLKQNPNGQGLIWNDKAAKTKAITFSNEELRVLKDAVNRLDSGKKVTSDLLTLCLMIRDEELADQKSKGG